MTDPIADAPCIHSMPCDCPKRTKDPLGILTDDQWDELHADLAEMAKRRRRGEAEAANVWLG